MSLANEGKVPLKVARSAPLIGLANVRQLLTCTGDGHDAQMERRVECILAISENSTHLTGFRRDLLLPCPSGGHEAVVGTLDLVALLPGKDSSHGARAGTA